MNDAVVAVLLLLLAYSIAVTCLLVYVWRQWGQAQADEAEQRSLMNSYLRADAMSRHPAGRDRLPEEIEAHVLDALNRAAEQPGTVIHGVWPDPEPGD